MTTDELAILREIRDIMADLLALSKSKRAAAPSNVATDAEMDSERGDPVIKWKVRDWTGDFVPAKMSEQPAAMLDLLALAYDAFYEKKRAADDPKARWELLNARLARGWAARLRAGWKPKAAEHVSEKEIAW